MKITLYVHDLKSTLHAVRSPWVSQTQSPKQKSKKKNVYMYWYGHRRRKSVRLFRTITCQSLNFRILEIFQTTNQKKWFHIKKHTSTLVSFLFFFALLFLLLAENSFVRLLVDKDEQKNTEKNVELKKARTQSIKYSSVFWFGTVYSIYLL